MTDRDCRVTGIASPHHVYDGKILNSQLFLGEKTYSIKKATGPFHSCQAHTQDGRRGVRQHCPFTSMLLVGEELL